LETYPNGAYVTEAQACLVRAKEMLFWESVECESRLQVQAYLGVYPSGAYVDEARQCLEQQLGLDRAARILVQQGLASLDYPAGIADGLFGPSTRAALRAWQRGKGFAATGYLTRAQADTLIAQGRDAVTAAAAQQQQEEADRLAQEAATREEAARRAREADDAAYAEAQRVDTAAAYGAYMATYPTGRHAAEARTRQRQRAETERLAQEAAARAADDAAYAVAERLDTAAAYGEYLRVHPAGRHTAEARTRQKERTETERLAQLPREVRNSIGMEFVLIEAGTFQMGSPAGERGWDDDEGPVHEVTISQPFYLGKYEVTQGEWQAVMGSNPSRFSNCGRTCPVENVSWDDAQKFIGALNRREGMETYRLPTEAEWEYAVRAGTRTAYHFGNAAGELYLYAWYGDTGVFFPEGTHPVGQKQPNAWGWYDMHGNVREWIVDQYRDYPSGPVTDLVQLPILVALVQAPSGCFAAGVGMTPPAIAALRIAIGGCRTSASASLASAWREPPNPVRCYPFTLYG